MLKGKNIILGITGGIAAYKTPWLVRELKKAGAEVKVVMTESAREFVTPLTLSTVSGHEVVVGMFPNQGTPTVQAGTWHIYMAQWADAMLVAPATANTIAKIAHGFADSAVTSLVLALRSPLILAPAMDLDMWEHPLTQNNIAILKEMGCFVLPPDTGELASGLVGAGRLPEIDAIVKFVDGVVGKTYRDLKGKKILVTAGPTYEPLDPVRFVGNRSSGKMGFAIATAAALRGADVTLVSGPVHLTTPRNVKRVDVETAEQMADAVARHARHASVVVMSAAVADFTPTKTAAQKIKKNGGELTLALSPTVDILASLGKHKNGKVLVGFALETTDGVKNAKEKLQKKNLDFIVLNNPTDEGAAFGGDTNVVTLIDRKGKTEKLPKMSKFDVATEILNRVSALLKK
jgi:phosphopantothenoylcysteine decarboxylase/phosphopantothenate--cysteine ligase